MTTGALPALGTLAPDFELPDQHGTPTRLSSFRGRRVVLVFFPWAFSSVCGGELGALRDDAASFVNETTALLAVSIDSKFALRAFAEREGYPFPLLADSWPHGEVTRRYGVFDDDAGAALRGTFVIDADGVVRWSVRNGIGEARDLDAYRSALAALSVG